MLAVFYIKDSVAWHNASVAYIIDSVAWHKDSFAYNIDRLVFWIDNFTKVSVAPVPWFGSKIAVAWGNALRVFMSKIV